MRVLRLIKGMWWQIWEINIKNYAHIVVNETIECEGF